MNETARYEGDDYYCDEVLSGHVLVERVSETEDVLAFRHTQPSWQTHLVVIPKRHISSLLDSTLAPDELLRLLAVVQTVAGQLVRTEGACRVITNLGGYQDSNHLHWHVVAGPALKRETQGT